MHYSRFLDNSRFFGIRVTIRGIAVVITVAAVLITNYDCKFHGYIDEVILGEHLCDVRYSSFLLRLDENLHRSSIIR